MESPAIELIEQPEKLLHGWIHRPAEPCGAGLVLTHGAGGNANGPLTRSLASSFCSAGVTVFRYTLPYRQARPSGPPRPAEAQRNQDGLAAAAAHLRSLGVTSCWLSGHSYGGRQASMLAAEHPEVSDLLVLFSYPLHPPGRPDQLRTKHLPQVQTPVFFVQGTKDPFGSPDEMEEALKLIRGRKELYLVEGAGHDLRKLDTNGVVERVLRFRKG